METINRYLDHAILKPEMSRKEVAEAVETGLRWRVKTVCVRPDSIELAKSLCAGTNTKVITVLAFPHGNSLWECKKFEAERYIALGVAEIDMVVNFALVRSGEWELVKKDITAVTGVARPKGVAVKVIIESCLLTPEEIRRVTFAAIEGEADFVKTSTGFNGPGAAPEAVAAMLEAAGGKIKVKPSGGIRDYETAKKYLDMGVHRLGVGYTSTETICRGRLED